MRYAVQGFRDGLREQIDEIRAQHVEVTRINYVHDTFRGPHGHADGRRKRLILELSAVSKEWVGVEELTHLSPELAVEHSARTGKTALRDLERLEEVGLIERKDRKVRVNQTAILAFLPIQANQVEVVEESN